MDHCAREVGNGGHAVFQFGPGLGIKQQCPAGRGDGRQVAIGAVDQPFAISPAPCVERDARLLKVTRFRC